MDEEEREKKPTNMAVKRSALAVCLVKGDDLDKDVLTSFQSPNPENHDDQDNMML